MEIKTLNITMRKNDIRLRICVMADWKPLCLECYQRDIYVILYSSFGMISLGIGLNNSDSDTAWLMLFAVIVGR